jgi:MFS family permease
MLAEVLARRLERVGIHYGWVIVAVTFFSSLVMSGAVGLPGAFIQPFTAEFGWDTAQISSSMAIRLVLFGLMGPFAAALIERYGVRRIVLIAQVLVLVGLAGALAMTRLWHLVALWGVVIGVGTGLTAMVLGAIVSARWFTERRGLVLGVLAAATATGQLIFLPLAAWLIGHYGWRFALIPSAAAIGLAAILIVLFMRDRPSDVGLRPYGETGPVVAPPPASTQGAITRAFGTLGDVSGVPAFWILAGSFLICGLSTNGLIQTHFISFCADYGLPAVMAASALALMGFFDFFGTIGSGYLSDRFDNRKLLFWYYGLRGLSLLWLPSSGFSFYGLSLFALFYGLDWIATVPPTVKLTGQVFGREKAGLVFGWIFASHQIGAAIAALGAGLTRTYLQTYVPAFWVAGGACLVAAALVMTVQKVRTAPAPVAAAA